MNGQHVLILGLGISGLAMARWCVRQRAQVTVADTREAPPQLAALRSELPDAQFVSGALDASLLQRAEFDALYRSPGLEPERFAPLLIAAKQAGKRCAGELDLFLQGLAALRESQGYQPKVVAITGTNGKTTVTALTGRLLERAGRSVAVAGNIGPTLLDTLTQRVDAGTLPDTWVLELSSFQLDGVEGFEPDAATLLNVTQDHLDWHGDMAAYAAAKARIFGATTHRVLNRDDALVMKSVPATVKGRVARYTTFGIGMPQRPGDFGIEDVSGMAWLVRALEADETLKRKRNAPQEELELHIQRLMPADALRIRGRHNAANALAALALAAAVDCPLSAALHALREYRGEVHRVEPVGILDGVEYFDDSKGTNVGATVAALEGLGAERKLVAILGGEGKGQDFSPLAAPVQRFARSVVLIGRDAPIIRAAIADTGVELLAAGSMEEAVALARAAAKSGDAVLLSPACASFDMFDNYPHRGRVFRAAVQALAHDAGIELGVAA